MALCSVFAETKGRVECGDLDCVVPPVCVYIRTHDIISPLQGGQIKLVIRMDSLKQHSQKQN